MAPWGKLGGATGVQCGVNHSQPNQPPASANASQGNGGAACSPRGRSKSAVRAGLSVSELNAEMIVDTEIVNANCRKNWPVIPVMNAHGTNTADSTRATAITGPETSYMAKWAACRGGRPSSMWCSTDSTTTMASSTTMPIARIKPNSVKQFKEKPMAIITA